MHKNEKTQNSHSFLALAFFRGICLSPILIFFKKKIFWVIIALFAILKCKCEKMYIFKHFAKSKKLFFCQYLSISVWFLLKFQKKYKIEAPYRTVWEGTEALKSYTEIPTREVEKESRAEPWKGTLEKTESTPTCNKLNKDDHGFWCRWNLPPCTPVRDHSVNGCLLSVLLAFMFSMWHSWAKGGGGRGGGRLAEPISTRKSFSEIL
jgi:hypothetical protein